jgi:hypothetical protein
MMIARRPPRKPQVVIPVFDILRVSRSPAEDPQSRFSRIFPVSGSERVNRDLVRRLDKQGPAASTCNGQNREVARTK